MPSSWIALNLFDPQGFPWTFRHRTCSVSSRTASAKAIGIGWVPLRLLLARRVSSGSLPPKRCRRRKPNRMASLACCCKTNGKLTALPPPPPPAHPKLTPHRPRQPLNNRVISQYVPPRETALSPLIIALSCLFIIIVLILIAIFILRYKLSRGGY